MQTQALPISINSIFIDKLINQKNLLAFSAGVDSSALFFLLLKQNISFDIAIIDYNIREQSKDEVAYAKELASKYHKKIYIYSHKEKIKSNFEAKARTIRFNFFIDIIQKHKYNNLITAHQLNDKLEWFLMQFIKGSGLNELLGMEEISKDDGFYKIKPLLSYSKDEILSFLNQNKIKYFQDISNENEKYHRNFIRKNFSNQLIEKYKNGISNSLKYLNTDKDSLFSLNIIFQEKSLYIIQNNNNFNIDIRNIDKILKKLGILISSKTREEIKNNDNCVVSHKIAISKTKNHIFIAPYLQETIDKKSREKYRIQKIPKNIRAYLYNNNIDIPLK